MSNISPFKKLVFPNPPAANKKCIGVSSDENLIPGENFGILSLVIMQTGPASTYNQYTIYLPLRIKSVLCHYTGMKVTGDLSSRLETII